MPVKSLLVTFFSWGYELYLDAKEMKNILFLLGMDTSLL